MTYTLRVLTSAKKDLRRLDVKILELVNRAIRTLVEHPRPPGCVKLSDEEDGYRIRVRNMRVLYQIDDRIKTVVVYRIKHRKEAYR